MADPVIHIENLSIKYQDITVLDSVNLTVNEGDFLAVLGPNGGGKTTLLKIIIGMQDMYMGTVTVFGRNAADLNDKRQDIGYVPQVITGELNFPVKVREVIMMGRYGKIGLFKRPGPADREAVEKAMEKMQITDLADRPVGRLSGGQKQRVFLARALANDPRLLLLDEPTTGVDSITTESLYELLHDLHENGMTIIIVSHDIGMVASHVSSIACLHKKLIAHGMPNEVITSNELTKMYGCEAVPLLHEKIPHIAIKSHNH